MFERFTNRARQVLVIARDEALGMGHNHLGPEHILLGLISEGTGVGGRALAGFGLTLDSAREQVKDHTVDDAEPPRKGLGQKPPFTPLAKRTLEGALREALGMRHNYIGTEHLLLSIADLDEGVARAVLAASGIEAGALRERVLQILSEAGVHSSEPGRRPESREGPPHLTAGMAAIFDAAAADHGVGDPTSSANVLCAMVDAGDSHAGRILAALGVTQAKLRKQLEEIPVQGTTDAPPPPEIAITVAGRTTVIQEPRIAALLQKATPAEMGELLQRLLDPDARRGGHSLGT